jgi:DNA-binding CsgD family transcriptional regulator
MILTILMKNRPNLILVLLMSLQFLAGSAQFVGKPYVINYDKRIYQADNQNWAVAASPKGVIYMGNGDGLVEFDGSNWNLYRMPDQGIVRSVSIGDDGNIYVGSYEEFGFWKADATGLLGYTSLSRVLLPPGSLHNDEIWRIIQHNGKIYFQSFSNIFVYDGAKISVLNPGSSMVLLIKASDRLFIHLVGKGLCEIIDDTFRLIPSSTVFRNDEIKVILPYGGNQFLTGVSGKGFYVFDGSGFEPWDHPTSSLIGSYELNNGISGFNRMVIGTIGNGVLILDSNGNLISRLNTHNDLQNNTVLSLSFDRLGNIWAGLDRGISLINLNTGLDFYIDPTGTMGSVYASVLDQNDLLIGTNQACYRYTFRPGEGYTDPVMIGGLAGQVWELKNFDGQILCGQTNGTFRISGSQSVMVCDVNGGFVTKRIQDRDTDILLQSTYSAFVLYGHQNGMWEQTGVVAGFYEPITDFEADHMGNFWCAHATRGIFRIRISADLRRVEETKMYGRLQGLPTDRQMTVAKVEGRIVFPTDQGCFIWDDIHDTIIPYSQLNERLGDFANARQIIRSRENYYWLIKGNEIAFYRITGFDAQELYRCDLTMNGVFLTSRFTRIITLREGLHLICLDNGFAIYDESGPAAAAESKHLAFRRVQAVSRMGHKIDLPLDSLDKPFRVPYSHRNIELTYSGGTGLRTPLYRTRLSRVDESWSDWGPGSSVGFNRLPSGDFTFLAEAKNLSGPGGYQSRFYFNIRPPWYASFAAYIFYAIILISLGVLLRISFLKRLRLHKEKIEKEEALIREQEKLQAERELIRVKSEKLEADVNFKNTQLADFTMSVIKRNEQLIRIRDEFLRHAREKGTSQNKTFTDKITRLIDQQLSSEDDWKTFETHFDQAHQDFIQRLKNRYPHLTQSDLKLCAYLRLNISSKEIAHLLNISLRGVEVRRYRLRKRLGMSTEDNLYEFLIKF